jgi:hypothetical protein
MHATNEWDTRFSRSPTSIARNVLVVAVASLAILSGARSGAASNSLAQWFNSGRCAAFDRPYVSDPAVPYVKTGHDDLIVVIPPGMQKSLPVPWYAYDPRAGVAYRHVGQDSGINDTVRFAGKPPLSVPHAALVAAHTTSGLKLGASAAAVVATLGKPFIVKGCGLQRYVYLRERGGQDDELDFTISNGRVVEIFSTLNG